MDFSEFILNGLCSFLFCLWNHFNIRSLSGFGDAITWKNIDDDDVDYVENFIKTKVLHVAQKMDGNGKTDQLVDFSGEFYASSPNDFEFLRGDRKQIKEIVAYVKKVVDADGDNSGIQYFAANKPNEKIEVAVDNRAKSSSPPTATHFF